MQIPQLITERSPFVSLEFFPPKKQEEWPGFLEVAQELKQLRPLFASVTYGAGGSTQSNTLEICEQLIRTCGFEIMPHLTGVAADKDKIDGFLGAIKAMGIDQCSGPARRSSRRFHRHGCGAVQHLPPCLGSGGLYP